MQVATNQLIQVTEVWRPDTKGDQLEWCAAHYADLEGDETFINQRKSQTFNAGEGIVGQAWATKVPVIAASDNTGEFDRWSPTHTIAIPSLQGDRCSGVVTLLCQSSDDTQAAFEVWRPNDRNELSLAESWYANLERFGLISSYVKFPRRAGLPGKVWDDRFPRVMGSLSKSAEFVRIAGAKAEGLSTAIGIPFMRSAREIEAVFLMLSASRSPIAKAMEVWAPDLESETPQLKIVSADYGPYVDLAPVSRRRRLKSGEGIAGRVFRDAAPWITSDLLGKEFPCGDKLVEYGFEYGVGLPVFVGEELFAVVTLLN